MVGKPQVLRVLFVGSLNDSSWPSRFDTLGWAWDIQALEAWLHSPLGPRDVAVIDMTGSQSPDTWLRIHHQVPRVAHPLVLIVDGPVPSSFHYPRAGGLRVALVPPSASPDVVRSTVNLARHVHQSVHVAADADDPEDRDERTAEMLEALRRMQTEMDAVRDLLDPAVSPSPRLRLGDREQEVCDLLMKGMSATSIGDRLDIAESTVKKHIHAIYRKKGVSNRAELMAQH